MTLNLTVTLEREQHEPGGPVKGVVHVAEGGAVRELRVSAGYFETTGSYTILGRDLGTLSLARGKLTTGADYPFEFLLPTDALPNYACQYGGLGWMIDVQADRAGRDQHEVTKINVAPTKRI